MILKPEEIAAIAEKIIDKKVKIDWLSDKYRDILIFLQENLTDAKDKEEVFDVGIDAINRMGFDFAFIAIFREDRKYSSAVRIRVDSDLVNRVEDYARKMMPSMTVMRYRIPIYEEGRVFRRFCLEQTKPLVTDSVKVSDRSEVFSVSITECYENLISKDSPLVLLLPAFKRIVPYKYAISTQIFVDGTAFGNLGVASESELGEEDLNVLLVLTEMFSRALGKTGFGKNYV